LSPTERAELNRQLKDAVEARLIRPSRSLTVSSARQFFLRVKIMARFDFALGSYANGVTRTDAYALPRVDDTLDELKDANFYTHLVSASSFQQVRVREEDVHKTAFRTLTI
jgi:hypothetical protein